MQRKTSKNRNGRGPNAAEKAFQGWLKEQPCCITGAFGVQVHHCVGATGSHNKVLIGHYFCLPMSVEIHNEYHAGTKAWREKYCGQSSLWKTYALSFEGETATVIPLNIVEEISNINK